MSRRAVPPGVPGVSDTLVLHRKHPFRCRGQGVDASPARHLSLDDSSTFRGLLLRYANPALLLACADPRSRDATLRLCEQAEVEAPRLLRWLEAEARVEDSAQALVPFGDGFAEPQRAFRFHCESPERLI